MTNEEAKRNISNALRWGDKADPEALRMAIKELGREPCEDCISREAAIRACCGMSRFTGIDEAPYEYVEDVLRELPSVKPKERTGHWIAVYQGDEIINYRCSECEFGNTFGKNTDGMYYCPACGVRMESGEGITASEAKKLGECFEEGFRKGLRNDRK